MRELESHRAHIAAAGLTRGIRLPASSELRSAVSAGARAPDLSPGRDAAAHDRAGQRRPHRSGRAAAAHAATLEQLARCQSRTCRGSRIRSRKPRSCCIGCRGASSTTPSRIRTSSRSVALFIRKSASLSTCRGGKSLAWAVDTRDASLLRSVSPRSIRPLRAEGRLASILDTYYGDSDRFDYIQSRVFMEHIEIAAAAAIATGSARPPRKSASIGDCSRQSATRNRNGIRLRLRTPACAA